MKILPALINAQESFERRLLVSVHHKPNEEYVVGSVLRTISLCVFDVYLRYSRNIKLRKRVARCKNNTQPKLTWPSSTIALKGYAMNEVIIKFVKRSSSSCIRYK